MDVPTPPTAAFTLNFESEAEFEDVDEELNLHLHAEKDRVDEPYLNIGVPGVGNLK